MGRKYAVTLSASISGAGDLIEVASPSDAITILHGFEFTQSTDVDSEQLRGTLSRASTSGSGGSTATPRPLEVGDAAYGGVVETQNGTPAGTLTTIHTFGFNVLNGYQWLPTPELRPMLSPSGIAVLRLETVPADALTVEITLWLEEVGG